MKSVSLRQLAALTIAALGLFHCGSEAVEDASLDAESMPAVEAARPRQVVPAQDVAVHWPPPGAVFKGKLTYKVLSGRGDAPPEEEVFERDAYDLPPLEDLPLEELANSFRARGGMPGMNGAVMDAEPAWEIARTIKNGDKTPRTVLPVAGEPPSPVRAPELHTALKPQYVLGGVENRTAIGGPPGADANRSVWIHSVASDGRYLDCSASYIGPGTLLTAAHCLRLNGVDFGHSMHMGPGRWDSYTGLWGPLQFRSSTNCYSWWYPTAWATSGESDYRYDFAVVSFGSGSCSIYPATTDVGWFGLAVNSNASSANVIGYPYTSCSGLRYPTNCMHGGGMWLDDYRWATDTIDMTKGQSGGAWLLGSGSYQLGITSHEQSFYCFPFSTCYENYARRIDSGLFGFVQTYTNDY